MDNLYEQLVNKTENLAIIGLGYVGLPLAIAFSAHMNVIGYDNNESKIANYTAGIDNTHEVGNEALSASKCRFTSNENELKNARFLIIAVPTPISSNKIPDFEAIISSSKTVGRNLQKGSVVVYESTVYPGVTEDICAPILEEESGLVCGRDFKIGYSPERINPGDKINRLNTIMKIVSGMDEQTLNIISKVYGIIIDAGVYKAESIKIAEAAKVVENSQRDINIAFMNELAMVFDIMNIDTNAVIRAMNTKWNALRFYPGLVGGHCIGVDPYYFIYRAEQLGYHSQLINAGRRINDGMSHYIADKIISMLIKSDKRVKGANIALLGITFKENCPDVRNTKVFDIIEYLNEYDINTYVVDSVADQAEIKQSYNIDIIPINDVKNADAVVVAVAHDCFKKIGFEPLLAMQTGIPILIDVKGIWANMELGKTRGCAYWSL